MRNIIISLNSKIYLFPLKKEGECLDAIYQYEEIKYINYVWLIFSITIYKSIKK